MNSLRSLLILVFCTVSNAKGLPYGAQCNGYLFCDYSAHLTCSSDRASGLCECISPKIMIYDFLDEKCGMLVGERCDYGHPFRDSREDVCVHGAECTQDGYCKCLDNFFKNGNNTCSPVILAGASCENDKVCTGNSTCVKSWEGGVQFRRCKCFSEFFQTVNATCDRRRPHGEHCESTEQCQPGLHCNMETGLCHCDPSQRYYDRIKRKCVGLANSNCSSYSECITNSRCRGQDVLNRTCACDSKLATSTNGSCLVTHGQTCGDWIQTCNSNQGLVCLGGKCQCKYELENFQNFSTEHGKCVSEVGGPCDEDIPCVKNCNCVRGECACKGGYVEVDGKCQLSIGMPCNYTELTPCDTAAPLYCINQKCQCAPLRVYDIDQHKCLRKVGASCPLRFQIDKENGKCIPGARCVKRRSLKKFRGICKCKEGWSPTADRICTKDASV